MSILNERMKITPLSFVLIAAIVLLAACGKTDAELTKEVNEKLAAEGISGVTANVANGVAALTGEVADIATKTKAEATARSVEGVESVDATSLKTKPTPPPPDPALKAKAEDELKKAGCVAVALTVEDGRVIATGKVPAAKFAECVAIIDEAGLGKMENELIVGN
jgi:osmotically-inducible protein OsmY